jgi:hypothetical protein
MCDYSLHAVKTRPAKVGDQLIVSNFNTGTRGFAEVDGAVDVAVCCLPGTEVAFAEPPQLYEHNGWFGQRHRLRHAVAKFIHINEDHPHMHHDALEFPDGHQVLLTYVREGQTAKVLQLPAPPLIVDLTATQEETIAEPHAA